jgi:recombination protein RecR
MCWPDDLRISQLEARFQSEPIREIVLALPTDVEGDATSYYLAKQFGARGVKVTRIAHGLPAGSGLDFADDLTLTRALEGRREMT